MPAVLHVYVRVRACDQRKSASDLRSQGPGDGAEEKCVLTAEELSTFEEALLFCNSESDISIDNSTQLHIESF